MTTKSKIQLSSHSSAAVSAIDPLAVKQYLLQHPEFFDEHTSLLSELEIKHDAGSAVSLVERQVQLLREKNSSLEKKILHLIQVAQDNEILEEQLHRIARRLIEIDHNKNIVPIINDLLSNEFPSLQIRLGLYNVASEYSLPAENKITTEDLDYVFYKQIIADNCRDCIFLRGKGLVDLFSKPVDVKSGVAIPLCGNKNFGVLLMGSANENRFYEGMGTLFLEYLADLLSRKLKKLLKH
ncbi:MAG: DUF484 family protein [Pseudomonadota bacterium]